MCAGWPAALRVVRSGVWLEASVREAVHALKYGGLPRIADDLAEVMIRLLPAPDESSALVPIPLSRERLRERGYNQSEWLARALGRRWGRPVAPTLLIRVRDTASQTALTPGARLANVAGAFAVGAGNGRGLSTPGHGPKVSLPGPVPVLVDDVFTTGATLAEAARALERAGIDTVAAVTFGRAVIPDFT